MVGITTALVVETGATKSHFGDNYTSGLVVHTITKGVISVPSHKAKNTMKLSINSSTG